MAKYWPKYFFDYYFKTSRTNSIAKAAKAAVLTDIYSSIKKKNTQSTNTTGCIEYGFVARQVRAVNRVSPDITRHDIYNELHRQAREIVVSLDADFIFATTDNGGMSVVDGGAETGNGARSKGGRPVGTTNVKKKVSELYIIAAKTRYALLLKMRRKILERNT